MKPDEAESNWWVKEEFALSVIFNSSVTSCHGSRTGGGAASHPREKIVFPPAAAHSLNEAIRTETSQSVLFLDSSQGSELSLLFLYSRGEST
jgi:hypothetical protein